MRESRTSFSSSPPDEYVPVNPTAVPLAAKLAWASLLLLEGRELGAARGEARMSNGPALGERTGRLASMDFGLAAMEIARRKVLPRDE